VRFLLKGSWIATLALTLTFLASSNSLLAEEKSPDDWVYDFELYAWLPTVKPTLPNGETLNWSLKDLLDNLDFLTMFNGGARKDKWSVGADFLYMNLGDTRTISGSIVNHPVDVEADLDLRALTFTTFAGYQIAESARNRTDIIGGVRYFYLRVPIKAALNDNMTRELTPKVITWDGIIGLRGKTLINDQWYFDYYGDVGTGQSSLTYQAKVGFGYNFNKWTGTFGYRHMRWNYKSQELLEDLTITGPYIGAKFTW